MTGIPSKFDWRDQGVVGPVVSQKNCGACWAFSTVGVAESMYAIKNGTLYSFSVQEVGRYIPDTLFYLLNEGTARKSVLALLRCKFCGSVLHVINKLTARIDRY